MSHKCWSDECAMEDADECTHQIPSNSLLFLTFYHFPYATDPPTSTVPMRPFPTIARSPSTIPYTHRTIGPVPRQRPPIWPTDHIVTFSFLSLFSFTRHILSRSDQSQIITPHDWHLTIHFTAHEPCAHFTYRLYLRLLYLLWKRRKFFPQNSDLSLSHLIVSLCSVFAPSYLCSTSYSRHPSPYHTVANLHLAPFCTPWYYIRRPFHCSRIAPLRTT